MPGGWAVGVCEIAGAFGLCTTRYATREAATMTSAIVTARIVFFTEM